MSEPLEKPGIVPESYSPHNPQIANVMGELCSEKVIDTVVIEGVAFTVIEKGKTLYAGAYAVEPDFEKNPELNVYQTDDDLLFAGRDVGEIIRSIRSSVTPGRNITLNIDYTTDERLCAMLIGQETTSYLQPEGVHIIEAEPTLLIKVEHTHAAFALTKKLTGKYIHQYQLSELFGLVKHIFCEGERAEYEYNGDNGSGNADAEYHLISDGSVGFVGNGYVTVPVKRKAMSAVSTHIQTKNAPAAQPVVPRIERDIQAAQVAIGFKKISFGGRDWLALDERDGKALIMTETVDCRRFHDSETEITWADCELRGYLNSEFYNSFSETEKARIIPTELPPCYLNPWHGPGGGKARIVQIREKAGKYQTDAGKYTEDRVFLLSIEELIRYTGDSGDMDKRVGWYWDGKTWDPEKGESGMVFRDGFGQFLFDQYNINRIGRNAKGEASWWRLRSPGYQYIFTVVVSPIGAIIFTGTPHTENGIRPAMWVKM